MEEVVFLVDIGLISAFQLQTLLDFLLQGREFVEKHLLGVLPLSLIESLAEEIDGEKEEVLEETGELAVLQELLDDVETLHVYKALQLQLDSGVPELDVVFLDVVNDLAKGSVNLGLLFVFSEGELFVQELLHVVEQEAVHAPAELGIGEDEGVLLAQIQDHFGGLFGPANFFQKFKFVIVHNYFLSE